MKLIVLVSNEPVSCSGEVSTRCLHVCGLRIFLLIEPEARIVFCRAYQMALFKMSTDGALERSTRVSRGKRMSKLLEEELEADEEFWNQEAFREEAEDNEYEAEAEEADIFDSDFDEDEPDEDEGDEDEDERRPVQKKLFSGKPSKKKGDKKKKSVTTRSVSSLVEIAASAAAGGGSQRPSAKPPRPPKPSSVLNQENRESNVDPEAAQGIRKSTRMAVVVKQAEREAQQAALQALAKPIMKKKKEEERKITQEEMLLEAAQTEIQNLQTLEIMLAREEEVKRKAVVHKATYNGPLIRFHSRDGVNTLGFTKVEEFPDIFNSRVVPYPKKMLCVITGQPAKYRDPRTGQPYATKDAYKLIRERFNKGENTGRKRPEESHQRKRTKVERERPGPGSRTNVAKLKFKKGVTTTDIDASSLSQRSGIVLGQTLNKVEVEVLTPTTQPSPDQPSDLPEDFGFSPLSTSIKNEGCTLRYDGNSIGRELPALDMPEPINEANEADFLLDDLEVCLPSNLDSSLSLPTSSGISPILLNNTAGNSETRDASLEQGDMMVLSSDQDQNLLPIDMLPFTDLDGLDSTSKEIMK